MKIKATRIAGFTLLEIMIIVAIIGLLAALAVPNFLKARATSQRTSCINNIRQIDAAIQQWALELKKPVTATVTETDATPYLKNTVRCPAGGTTFADSYTLNTVADMPVCKKLPLVHILD